MVVLLTLSTALLALLVIEWWRPLRSVRALAVLLALILLGFAQPGLGRAVRAAIEVPAADRATGLGGEHVQPDGYASGVLTMERAVERDAAFGMPYRAIAIAGLVWLAVSQSLRRRVPAQVVRVGRTSGGSAA